MTDTNQTDSTESIQKPSLKKVVAKKTTKSTKPKTTRTTRAKKEPTSPKVEDQLKQDNTSTSNNETQSNDASQKSTQEDTSDLEFDQFVKDIEAYQKIFKEVQEAFTDELLNTVDKVSSKYKHVLDKVSQRPVTTLLVATGLTLALYKAFKSK